jgi:hypothetical protein
MVDDQSVIALQEKKVDQNTFVEELTADGFAVRSCGGIVGMPTNGTP